MATWSYSGDPSSSSRDAVRFTIGDTDSTQPQLNDPEIDYLLTENGAVLTASVEAALALAARYSRQVSMTDDKVSRENQQKAEAYAKLAETLKARVSRRAHGVYAGGLSIAGKVTSSQDPDLVQPSFTVNMDDRPSGEVKTNGC